MDRAQVEQLVEQVGPILDPLELIYFPGQDAWGVLVDERTSVLVDYDEPGRLILSCELGKPPMSECCKLYELLLICNSLRDEAGGFRFYLDGPQGQVVLRRESMLGTADPMSLADDLRSFARAAEIWRAIVAREGEGAQWDDLLNHGAIKM